MIDIPKLSFQTEKILKKMVHQKIKLCSCLMHKDHGCPQFIYNMVYVHGQNTLCYNEARLYLYLFCYFTSCLGSMAKSDAGGFSANLATIL